MNLLAIIADHPRAAIVWPSNAAILDRNAALIVIVLLIIMAAAPATDQAGEAGGLETAAGGKTGTSPWLETGQETIVGGYAGAPFYHRRDLHLARPDGTDMVLKDMGWDGDALYFPIDGGARYIRWTGSLGIMVDFHHNKAIARLGKGAHGRKVTSGIAEEVETTGTLKGEPAPSAVRLTNMFQRLEFTHGHNTLLLTGLARLAPIVPLIRPYVGIGFGAAVPHVEVRFTGESAGGWTNQYQYAGPAFQVLAGLELRIGRVSYFVEYKFVWASIHAALTGGKSWSLKDLKSEWLPRWLVEPFSGLTEMPGDLWQQFNRWRTGQAPVDGMIDTELLSHSIVFGGGYVWSGTGPAGAAPPSH